jgi:hypothetical protein
METGCIQEWDFLIKKNEKCCFVEEKAGFSFLKMNIYNN